MLEDAKRRAEVQSEMEGKAGEERASAAQCEAEAKTERAKGRGGGGKGARGAGSGAKGLRIPRGGARRIVGRAVGRKGRAGTGQAPSVGADRVGRVLASTARVRAAG